jgi:hypothetical protein
MRNFLKIASGIETLPLLLDLHRQPELWNQHPDRTRGDSPHRDVDDIWIRFRAYDALTSAASFGEPFVPEFYPAWHALAHLRPIVFGIMARCEAVQLGGVLITRVPPGKRVAPHDDRGRWHPVFFGSKVYVVLASNPGCYNTCEDETVVMSQGEAWSFDNLKTHSTVNGGETDRVTLIVSMRCE